MERVRNHVKKNNMYTYVCICIAREQVDMKRERGRSGLYDVRRLASASDEKLNWIMYFVAGITMRNFCGGLCTCLLLLLSPVRRLMMTDMSSKIILLILIYPKFFHVNTIKARTYNRFTIILGGGRGSSTGTIDNRLVSTLRARTSASQ